MEIVNKTPHPITLCKTDGTIIRVYEPEGDPIRIEGNTYWFKREQFMLKCWKVFTKKRSSLSHIMLGIKGISKHLIKAIYKGFPNPKKYVVKAHGNKHNDMKIINEPEPKENTIYVVSSKVMAFSDRKDYAAMLICKDKHAKGCLFTGLILQQP